MKKPLTPAGAKRQKMELYWVLHDVYRVQLPKALLNKLSLAEMRTLFTLLQRAHKRR